VTWVVSVKGVLRHAGRYLLARNDRGEWELPGGQLEESESPEQGVAREVYEETNLRVDVGPVLRAWNFEVVAGRHVVVIAYGCTLVSPPADLTISDEHAELRFFERADLAGISLPEGYRRALDDSDRIAR
jgi:8-oxo-dGTP pyrophosphatase MutT (NUDIX family)